VTLFDSKFSEVNLPDQPDVELVLMLPGGTQPGPCSSGHDEHLDAAGKCPGMRGRQGSQR
jgi:hypothetical protein